MPETALHPAAARALRGAIERASERTQVLITSHSPDLLDDVNLQPESVRAVVSEDGNTHITTLDNASVESMRQHPFHGRRIVESRPIAAGSSEPSAADAPCLLV